MGAMAFTVLKRYVRRRKFRGYEECLGDEGLGFDVWMGENCLEVCE